VCYQFKRHPLAISAYFRHCLVLTYAFPQEVLKPLLTPGLTLDTYQELGFLAVAMVQTEALRPAFLPPMFGQDFFLAGYRVFARYQNAAGRSLRGLRILRSDTDRSVMAAGGNLLTHYGYHRARVQCVQHGETLRVRIRTPRTEADLEVTADLASKPAPLPENSPFASPQDARKYAGPLPFTFDYEPETHSMIIVQGVREQWDPQPIRVEVRQNTFLHGPLFQNAKPTLANAFHLAGVPYRWQSGIREALPRGNGKGPVG
jgi:Uncharacterized conserved protein (COG2071)